MNTSHNTLQTLFLLVLSFFLWTCIDESALPELEGIQEIEAQDNGNRGNASDIEVFFRKQFETNDIQEYRIFAIKSDKAAAFSLEDANAMPTDKYTQVGLNETYPIKGKVLAADAKDTDGDIITERVLYRFAILTVAKDKKQFKNTLVIDEDDFELKTNNLIFDYSKEFEAGSGSLSIDQEGNLYMADFNVVYRVGSPPIQTEFPIHKIAKNKTVSKFSGPYRMLSGNVFDAQDNLYQSELYGNQIIKTDLNGTASIVPVENMDLLSPDGIYVNKEGNIFVASETDGTIIKIPPNGIASVFANVGDAPRGITADEQGNLYISHNHESGKISKISPDGEVAIIANVPTFKPETYPLDYYMWLGYITYHEGNLYVPSIGANQIYKVSLEGKVELFAGSSTRGIPRGGALTADLNRPIGLAFSADGTSLYISGCTDNVPQHTQASRPAKIWELKVLE
ncbi:MAG: hypothetical protein AAF806_00925 [Bacteroidota bacterium]